MSNRNILSISPITHNWYEDEKGVVVVENFFNKRRIFLEEDQLSKLWKIIIEDSNYKTVERKFFELGRENFKECLSLLKRAGIIKVYYYSKVAYEKRESK